jgi:hypothetical protein
MSEPTPPPGWQQPPQPPAWNHPVDRPLPGPDPTAEIRDAATPRTAGRATLVLGALAVLAVGLLAGVLLRGAFGSTANASTGPGGGQAPSGYGFGQNGNRAGGEGFPGGAGGFGDQAGNATSGTITAVSSDGFTMKTSSGDSVKVTIGSSTTVSITATGATSGSLAEGQTVVVIGTESNGTIAATAVREGEAGRFGGLGGQGGRAPGQGDGQTGGA